ncbi:Putative protein of unknown function [Podospora comata]|uniref:Uncharacterized protein n=1 Tax=Podospora comata TaxID=48703 RepID=A0ABY6RX35_PODCO|nr:Putative protein of unknown function [Podospora comata]
MISLPETTSFDSSSQVCASASGYLWYICTFTTPWYAGCCDINPCHQQPVGCPLTAQGEPVTSTISTFTSPSLREATATITTTADISSQITLPASIFPATQEDNQEDSHGMTISINALVGVVVGCTIAVIFVALVTCMWWSRQRRERDEKRQQAQRLASPRLVDEELVPPGLEGVFNPMASDGPGSIFDRAEGRMSKISHESGSFPILPPLRDSYLSGSTPRKLATSPLSPNTPNTSSTLPKSAELDSSPMCELSSSDPPKHGKLPCPQQEDKPRADRPTAGDAEQYSARTRVQHMCK